MGDILSLQEKCGSELAYSGFAIEEFLQKKDVYVVDSSCVKGFNIVPKGQVKTCRNCSQTGKT